MGGSGLPVPSRRTFATGILPCAHSTQARFGILPLARLRGRRDWHEATSSVGRGCPCHPAGRSLRASCPALTPCKLASASCLSLACKAGEIGTKQPLPLHPYKPWARARGLREQMPTPLEPGFCQLVRRVTVPQLALGASMWHTPCPRGLRSSPAVALAYKPWARARGLRVVGPPRYPLQNATRTQENPDGAVYLSPGRRSRAPRTPSCSGWRAILSEKTRMSSTIGRSSRDRFLTLAAAAARSW